MDREREKDPVPSPRYAVLYALLIAADGDDRGWRDVAGGLQRAWRRLTARTSSRSIVDASRHAFRTWSPPTTFSLEFANYSPLSCENMHKLTHG